MFGGAFFGREIDGATFCRFHQGAAGDVVQRTLARGVRHIFIKGWRINHIVVVVMSMVMAVVATAAGRGGMFGHRLTVLRAKGLQPK